MKAWKKDFFENVSYLTHGRSYILAINLQVPEGRAPPSTDGAYNFWLKMNQLRVKRNINKLPKAS